VNSRRSHRRGWTDAVLALVALRPWRCRTCEHRFYAWSVPAGFVGYVHCRRCGNLDLQHVSRELVDEGPLRLLWRALRTPAYRCAPCRYRFFSLRPEYPVETLPQRAAEPAGADSPPPGSS
jgi:hypothetical protein